MATSFWRLKIVDGTELPTDIPMGYRSDLVGLKLLAETSQKAEMIIRDAR
jgi:hypothetical protein